MEAKEVAIKILNNSFHMKRKEDIMEKTLEEEDFIGRADQGKRKWRSLILNFLLYRG